MTMDYPSRLRKLDEVIRAVPYQYQHRDRLRNDVAELLRTVSTVQAQTGTFSGGGQSATLFYLFGVLPITYRGATYNIPVTIYFDPPYPHRAPRCFVTPTGNMRVSENHPNVDKGGMVYFPYLSTWNDRTSSLVELAAGMVSLFSMNCPVYSTTQASSAQPPQHATTGHPSAQGALGGILGALGGLFGGAEPPPVQPSPSPAAVPLQPVRPVQPVQPVQPARPIQPVPVAHVVARPIPARGASQKDELTRQLQERWPLLVGALVDDANAQMDKRRQLRAEAKQVEEQLAALKRLEQQQCLQVQRLAEAEAELSAYVTANEGKEVDANGLKAELDPNSAQVLALLAEEYALEEFIVALDELLDGRKIDLDIYVREIRDVSRRRFNCQALRQKSEATVRAAAAAAAAEGVALRAATVP